MKLRSEALAAGLVLVFVGVVGDASVLTTLGSPTAVQMPLGLLDRLTRLIQEIDQFLETVLDLLRTLSRLFGGGGGD